MDRLTREMTFEEEYIILQKEVKELFDKEDRESEPPKSNCVVRRALRCIKKLVAEVEQYKEYKDLEEQGLLLRLPCKVGDDIYAIPSEVNYRLNKSFGAKGLNAICRQVVDHIEFNSYGYLVSTNEGMTVHRQEAFGETWFLTRDEAEQKLREMESD